MAMRFASRPRTSTLAALTAVLAVATTLPVSRVAHAQPRHPQPANNGNGNGNNGNNGTATVNVDNSAVDDLMHQGVSLRERGQDEAALNSFAQAWQLSHRAEARAQMGLAEQALGRWTDAEAHLNEALGLTDPWITRNRRALQGALTEVRRHLGSLEVLSNVQGAEVRVGGQLVGRLPLSQPMRLAIGSTTIVVSAPGMASVTRTVTIDATALARETVNLEPDTGNGSRGPGPQPVGQPPMAVSTVCPAGQVVTPETAGHCCWVGQVWAGLRQVCVGTPAACPAGLTPQGDACVAAQPGTGTPGPVVVGAQPYPQPPPYGVYPQPMYGPVAPVLDDAPEMTITTLDAASSHRTSVRSGGRTFECDGMLSAGHPCVLREVPPGGARLRFGPRGEVSHSIHVPNGRTNVVIHRRGWGGTIAGFVLGGVSGGLFIIAGAVRSGTGYDASIVVGTLFAIPAVIFLLEDLLRSRYEVRVVDVFDDRLGGRRMGLERGIRFRGLGVGPDATNTGAMVTGAFTF